METNSTIFLTVEDVRDICHEYAKTRLAYDEPIPDFCTRFPNKLESILAVPPQTYHGELIYKTMSLQAAVLFYHMIMSHPFLNGNKRIACVSLMTFLLMNGKWLQIVKWETTLYEIAVDVATSKPEERKDVLEKLNATFGKYIVDK